MEEEVVVAPFGDTSKRTRNCCEEAFKNKIDCQTSTSESCKASWVVHSQKVKTADQTRSKGLNWSKSLGIICDNARGLLYLHQDSGLRII
ncbi:hypothetical protein QQP08_021613 [Theobroma cacao]|nr:hypothetical protein QQP08_021613 [Theobroma cacao]